MATDPFAVFGRFDTTGPGGGVDHGRFGAVNPLLFPHDYAYPSPADGDDTYDSPQEQADRLGAVLSSRYVAQDIVQTAQSAPVQPFEILFADGLNTPFEIRAIDYDNAGVGAGTANHLVFFGFNTGRHATGPVTANKPAWMMGMEDNYFANGGDEKYGPEWYVQYYSPDGSSQVMFRPFYARVLGSDSNTPAGAINISNIGPSNGGGSFRVNGGAQSTGDTGLFTVTWTQITLGVSTVVQAVPLTLNNQSGDVNLFLDASGTGYMQFRKGTTRSWVLASTSTNAFAFYNKDFNPHLSFTYGASASAAVSDFASGVKIQGGFSAFNNALVTTRPAVTGSRGGNAALASLLTALASYGLVTDSTTA